VEFSGVFWKIYDAAASCPRYISNRGGTRSGKTFSTLQFLHLIIPRVDAAGDVTSVVSDTLPHLKRGAIRDFETILGHPLKYDECWNATDNTYTYPNGAKIEFFSTDNAGKVRGPARKRLFINECNLISWEVFMQLDVRTRVSVFLDYNPTAPFWAIEKVEPRENCRLIKTTYLDNIAFLTAAQVQAIEANKTNEAWWRVYGLGEIGRLEGAVYDFEEVDAIPEGLPLVYGLDFGFAADPTAIVRVGVDVKRREIYAEEVCYERGLLNAAICDRLDAAGVGKGCIYADCAEPKSIEEIHRAGFNVRPCTKGAPVRSDKLAFQIQWMKGWRLFITRNSPNLLREARAYTWATDKDGNTLPYPIDQFNHLLDALRYAVYTHYANRSGGTSVSFI
jgi:phage terminase large subunit